ncbi:MAG: FHA domain-containing protein [Ruminococcus sp.]|nr:FHA domain-containing protein [Ruminococcus sp.]
MNLIKCNNNHFYDADKFSKCPHCNAGAPVRQSPSPAVIAEKDLHTVAMDVPDDAGQRDIVTIPAENPRPVSVPGFGDAVTIPLEQPVHEDISPVTEPTAPASPEDDEHTIGFYNAVPDMFEKGIEPVVGWLVVLSGKMRGSSLNIYTGRSFIGRGDENDIVLKGDMSISRQKHAVIVFEPKAQAFLLQPGTSRELFYLNGEVVLETKKLSAYDRIELGQTELLFVPLCGENFSWNDNN